MKGMLTILISRSTTLVQTDLINYCRYSPPDIHSLQMISPNDFGYHLTFPSTIHPIVFEEFFFVFCKNIDGWIAMKFGKDTDRVARRPD